LDSPDFSGLRFIFACIHWGKRHLIIRRSKCHLGNPGQEIVADLGACILLQCLGQDVESDPGFCWQYIQHYATRAKLNPIAAIQRVLKRTCEAVAFVLAEYDRIKAEQPTAEPVAA
jgi:hypothetical protein